MEAQIVRMRFHSAVRIGQSGVGIEKTDTRLSADTLFTALLSQLACRDPALIEPLVAAFPRRDGPDFTPGDPPFLLSSTFPFAGDVLFFPPPTIQTTPIPATANARSDSPSDAKKLKKVDYVSEALFARLLRGETLARFGQDKSTRKLQDDKVWLTEAEYRTLPDAAKQHGKLWAEQRRPRVAVDRLTQRSNIFHHGEVFFGEGCGLWFAVQWRDPNWALAGVPIQTVFRALFDDLAVMGIGQLRSNGLGSFDYDFDSDRTFPEPNDLAVSLSRFHPAPGDMALLSDASYVLTQIGGRMNANGRTDRERLSVGMMREGAVLSVRTANEGVAGCLVNAADPDACPLNPHPSWRYGLMFPIGLERNV
ncbi:MAG: type III-A CRISPR-associated RAMP protein Csm4 [Aggregatilineales bacterium]